MCCRVGPIIVKSTTCTCTAPACLHCPYNFLQAHIVYSTSYLLPSIDKPFLHCVNLFCSLTSSSLGQTCVSAVKLLLLQLCMLILTEHQEDVNKYNFLCKLAGRVRLQWGKSSANLRARNMTGLTAPPSELLVPTLSQTGQ